MNIPAPTPIGSSPAISLRAPFGKLPAASLESARSRGRAPVFLHRLGDDIARQQRGPREMREELVAALEANRWENPWGLGAVCRIAEEAAHFATAGYTWFHFEASIFLHPRAETMSLDDLDVELIELEDTGAFLPGWHDRYLEPGSPLHFSDEALARMAIRFGPALAEVDQILQAVRTTTPLRGDLPDFAFSLERSGTITTMDELRFLRDQLLQRGFLSGGAVRLIPCFGHHCELGSGTADDALPILDSWLGESLSPLELSVPQSIAAQRPDAAGLHWDATAESSLEFLRLLAGKSPRLFRDWAIAARDAFPTSKSGLHLTTTEDDVRFLPEVDDAALEATFLDQVQGRQLLLATWDDVAEKFAGRPELAVV